MSRVNYLKHVLNNVVKPIFCICSPVGDCTLWLSQVSLINHPVHVLHNKVKGVSVLALGLEHCLQEVWVCEEVEDDVDA